MFDNSSVYDLMARLPAKGTQCNMAKYCNFGTSPDEKKGNSGRSQSSVTWKHRKSSRIIGKQPTLSAQQKWAGFICVIILLNNSKRIHIKSTLDSSWLETIFKKVWIPPTSLFLYAKTIDFYLTSLLGMKHSSPWMELLTCTMFDYKHWKLVNQTLIFK